MNECHPTQIWVKVENPILSTYFKFRTDKSKAYICMYYQYVLSIICMYIWKTHPHSEHISKSSKGQFKAFDMHICMYATNVYTWLPHYLFICVLLTILSVPVYATKSFNSIEYFIMIWTRYSRTLRRTYSYA